MTRIFEAFKRAQVKQPSAPPAPPPAFDPPSPFVTNIRGSAAPAARPSPPPGIVVLPAPAALPDEALREMAALRVALESALPERATRALVFASSTAREGTTTIVSQFANALASDPRVRVLVIDAHARRPALARELDRQLRTSRGDAAPPTECGSVSLLPLERAQQLSGLVQPAALRALLESVSTSYDWILFDGPPILEAPEASALGAIADGVVLVVRAGHAKKPVLSRSVDLLRKAGSRVLGTVLNRRRLEIPGFIYRRI